MSGHDGSQRTSCVCFTLCDNFCSAQSNVLWPHPYLVGSVLKWAIITSGKSLELVVWQMWKNKFATQITACRLTCCTCHKKKHLKAFRHKHTHTDEIKISMILCPQNKTQGQWTCIRAVPSNREETLIGGHYWSQERKWAEDLFSLLYLVLFFLTGAVN